MRKKRTDPTDGWLHVSFGLPVERSAETTSRFGRSGSVEVSVFSSAFCERRGALDVFVMSVRSSATTKYVGLPDGIDPVQLVASTLAVWQTSVSLPLPSTPSGPES